MLYSSTLVSRPNPSSQGRGILSESPNLFEHVFRQPPTTKRANDENLATEITAYFLHACQPFRSRFLRKIDSSLAGLEWQPVVTQKMLSAPSGSALRWDGSRPDLFLSCLSPKVIVIVEVKIDAVTTGGADITQMTCYEEYLQHELDQQHQENVFLATLTRWAPDQWLKSKNIVLVHRELEYRPVVVSEWRRASCQESRGFVPRRFIAVVPIPKRRRAGGSVLNHRPLFGLGPRDGARVAPLRCPVLRPGHYRL